MMLFYCHPPKEFIRQILVSPSFYRRENEGTEKGGHLSWITQLLRAVWGRIIPNSWVRHLVWLPPWGKSPHRTKNLVFDVLMPFVCLEIRKGYWDLFM